MIKTLEPRTSALPPVRRPVTTGVDVASPETSKSTASSVFLNRWQNWISNTLDMWLRDPSQLEDDGVDAPKKPVLRLAIDYAEKFRDEGYTPPDNIFPDPNGGIMFALKTEGITEMFHFQENGVCEYLKFHGPNLLERTSL